MFPRRIHNDDVIVLCRARACRVFAAEVDVSPPRTTRFHPLAPTHLLLKLVYPLLGDLDGVRFVIASVEGHLYIAPHAACHASHTMFGARSAADEWETHAQAPPQMGRRRHIPQLLWRSASVGRTRRRGKCPHTRDKPSTPSASSTSHTCGHNTQVGGKIRPSHMQARVRQQEHACFQGVL